MKGPKYRIIRWVDYSKKYGIAYQLSNNAIGVHFNDNTKLIYDPASQLYHFYERVGVDKVDKKLSFKSDAIPPHCEKKLMIHSQFRQYIQGDDAS